MESGPLPHQQRGTVREGARSSHDPSALTFGADLFQPRAEPPRMLISLILRPLIGVIDTPQLRWSFLLTPKGRVHFHIVDRGSLSNYDLCVNFTHYGEHANKLSH